MVSGRTFPDDQDAPTEADKLIDLSIVPIAVLLDLALPEVGIRPWKPEIPATTVSMPETSMNHDHDVVPWKNDIGLSRQILLVEAIAKSTPMKTAPDLQLRRSILCADP
jgi:hypothetical protein